MALSRNLVGVPTGYMVLSIGWNWFFVVCALISIPGVVMLLRYEKWAQPINLWHNRG